MSKTQPSKRKTMAVFVWLSMWAVFGGLSIVAASMADVGSDAGSVTVMFYLNGDNDLTDEVLSALDRLEAVGSSKAVNLVALVDGHPDGVRRFHRRWSGTRLLHITADDRAEIIHSTLLADWGEQDLGSPVTVARFVRAAVDRFPARRYVFCTFAHGRGVIDTGNLAGDGGTRTLFISPDDSSQSIISLEAFAGALKEGLQGRRFSSIVLFSCLSGMVEIAFELREVTDYLVASQDEIHLVNEPAGTHQLRGIALEELPRRLKIDPLVPDIDLGAVMVDGFIAPYNRSVISVDAAGRETRRRYPATLAVIDCRATDRLAASLDDLAIRLIDHLGGGPDTAVPALAAIGSALNRTVTFKSFMNLEYYDLLSWLETLARATEDAEVRNACRRSADILVDEVIGYERHTADLDANGLSIYFSHPLVPDNVDAAHRTMYARTRFARDTRWDELIGACRTAGRRHRAELLLYRYRRARDRGDLRAAQRLAASLQRHLQHRIRNGNIGDGRQFAALLDEMPAGSLPPGIVELLKKEPAQE